MNLARLTGQPLAAADGRYTLAPRARSVPASTSSGSRTASAAATIPRARPSSSPGSAIGLRCFAGPELKVGSARWATLAPATPARNYASRWGLSTVPSLCTSFHRNAPGFGSMGKMALGLSSWIWLASRLWHAAKTTPCGIEPRSRRGCSGPPTSRSRAQKAPWSACSLTALRWSWEPACGLCSQHAVGVPLAGRGLSPMPHQWLSHRAPARAPG